MTTTYWLTGKDKRVVYAVEVSLVSKIVKTQSSPFLEYSKEKRIANAVEWFAGKEDCSCASSP
jgi:hypothetical protein